MLPHAYEGSHDTNIVSLINEFGQDKKDEIKRLYQDQRALLERGAEIKEFLPVLAYRIVREILLAQCREGELERRLLR